MNWKWRSDTHDAVAEAALTACPEEIRETTRSPFGHPYFLLGIEAPDRLFQDFSNHYYNCTPSPTGRHSGWVHKKIAGEIALTRKMLADISRVILHPRASYFLQGILDSPFKAICFQLGTTAHYIADAFQPLHTDGKARFKKEEIPHKLYEFDVNRWKGLREISVENTPKRREDPSASIVSAAQWANGFYMAIIDAYLKPDGRLRSSVDGRLSAVEKETAQCLSRAASLTRDMWLSLDGLADALTILVRKERLVDLAREHLATNRRYKTHVYRNGSLRFTTRR